MRHLFKCVPVLWLCGCHLIVGIEETRVDSSGGLGESGGLGGTAMNSGGTSGLSTGGTSAGGGGSNAGGSNAAGSGGSTGGGSSTGGAPAQCSSDGDCAGPAGICETGVCVTRGPTMVSVGSFWIDATEVTRAHYRAFLAAKNGDTSGQPDFCSWNTSYQAPEQELDGDDLPVASVDWCDARAFCEWANKRLCGKIGGGPLIYDESTDSGANQWYRACAGTNGAIYPYGFNFVAGHCNDESAQNYQAIAVGSLSECRPAASAVFDITGNVIEWIDLCEASETDQTDQCQVRGGSYISNNLQARCNTVPTLDRDALGAPVGFRCCSK
jgi:hypothetical protein